MCVYIYIYRILPNKRIVRLTNLNSKKYHEMWPNKRTPKCVDEDNVDDSLG